MEEDGDNVGMEEGATCQKFGVILGCFRTEVEVLAELPLGYLWQEGLIAPEMPR